MRFCSHCGFNLEADRPVERGVWRITPTSVEHAGQPVRATPAEVAMLHSLATARGEFVTPAVLAERTGYEGDDPGNIAAVTLCRLRRRLPAVPFESVYGFGYRWAA